MAQDIDGAYAYALPGFRAVVPVSMYRSRYGAAPFWLASEVVRVDCPETAKCQVVVRLDVKPVLAKSAIDKITTHLDETWLLEDGKWWLFENVKS